MKKILTVILSIILIGLSFSYAKSTKVTGTVSLVDTVNKRITIENVDGEKMVFAVVPSTEIEFENKFLDNAKFTDLKVGQYVKIKYTLGTTKTLVAEDIDIYTGSKN